MIKKKEKIFLYVCLDIYESKIHESERVSISISANGKSQYMGNWPAWWRPVLSKSFVSSLSSTLTLDEQKLTAVD